MMIGERELLARQLDKIGGDAGPGLELVCCGPGDAPAGAARAASFVSDLLPVPRWQTGLVLPMPADAAVRRLHNVFSHAGRLYDVDQLCPSSWPVFGALLHDRAGLGAGVFAAAAVVDVSEEGTHVVLGASVRQGQPHDRTVELALTRLAARLREGTGAHAPLVIG